MKQRATGQSGSVCLNYLHVQESWALSHWKNKFRRPFWEKLTKHSFTCSVSCTTCGNTLMAAVVRRCAVGELPSVDLISPMVILWLRVESYGMSWMVMSLHRRLTVSWRTTLIDYAMWRLMDRRGFVTVDRHMDLIEASSFRFCNVSNRESGSQYFVLWLVIIQSAD